MKNEDFRESYEQVFVFLLFYPRRGSSLNFVTVNATLSCFMVGTRTHTRSAGQTRFTTSKLRCQSSSHVSRSGTLMYI